VSQADRQERRIYRRAGPFEGAWSGATAVSGVRIADLSEGGCVVEALNAPEQDERVMVRLALTPSCEITVEGHVVKVDPWTGFGVQFNELRTEQRHAIRTAVRDMLNGDGGVMGTTSRVVESITSAGAPVVIEYGFAN